MTAEKDTDAAPDGSPELLEVLRRAFPDEAIAAVRAEARIEQANAEGYRLELRPSGRRVFCKVVDAARYRQTKRDWADLRRTLCYARTEARFYRTVLPELRRRGFDAAPRAFLAECRLEGLVEEAEPAVPVPGAGARAP